MNVYVNGQPKGELHKENGRWNWYRVQGMGIDAYPRGTRLPEIKTHIARVCLSSPDQVFLGNRRTS